MKLYTKLWAGFILFALFALTGCGKGKTISLEELLQTSGYAYEETGTSERYETRKTPLEKEESLVVYVCGEVLSPGVYELRKGSRIIAAIEAAGGFTLDAASEAINLAKPLEDGMQITIPSVEEAKEVAVSQAQELEGLVNINLASVETLCTLPGIGEAKAKNIIQHRDTNGLFQSTEELIEVAGIGENLYLQIKDKIYID